jgi:hypothetical protein
MTSSCSAGGSSRRRGPHGDRLLEIITPLIAARQDQQGARVSIYRVPPGLSPEAAARWHKRAFDARADLGVDTPRFQLILGDLDQVSLGVQQVQSSTGSSVASPSPTTPATRPTSTRCCAEREPAPQPRAARCSSRCTTAPPRPAPATARSSSPGVEVVRRRQLAGEYPAREIVEFGDPSTPSPDELLDGAAVDEPGVLFTVSHGEGAPRGGWRSRGAAPPPGRDELRPRGHAHRRRPARPHVHARRRLVHARLLRRRHPVDQRDTTTGSPGSRRGPVPRQASRRCWPGCPRRRPPVHRRPAASRIRQPERPARVHRPRRPRVDLQLQELDSGSASRPARFMASCAP